MKNIEASKVTNEWKAIKSQAMGLALIRQSEVQAADKERLKKITQLQKLAVTASTNEVVVALTASKNEAWRPSPASLNEVGENPKKGRKANKHADSPKSPVFGDSENHTSNNEVLSTVAIPMGDYGDVPATVSTDII